MAKADRNVVWILGSGFSRGLGGPLLYELLSRKAYTEIQSKFREKVKSCGRVYGLYWKHWFGNTASDEKIWSHAEEFLDFVDTAVSATSPRHDILAKFLKSSGVVESPTISHEDFRRHAIRAVAAECLFTEPSPDLKGEAWEPYLAWSQGLSRTNNTIVTFNYDLVLEHLAKPEHAQYLNGRSFVLPGFQEGHGALPVYKLHGSVNWRRPTKEELEEKGREAFIVPPEAILDQANTPLIATPGPTKKRQANGDLDTLWNRATYAISHADVIVFMGYRFPPSDSQARRRILGAIKDSKVSRLRVHTVLGPRTKEDDTVRLEALLKATLQSRTVDDAEQPIVHPLYVEDFLTVLHEGML
jgi:hypothetical protein